MYFFREMTEERDGTQKVSYSTLLIRVCILRIICDIFNIGDVDFIINNLCVN